MLDSSDDAVFAFDEGKRYDEIKTKKVIIR
jgi:hypothetical protein